MGSTQSHNIIDNSISAMVSSVNSASQNCVATASTTQSIDATTGENCEDASIDISNVKFDSKGKVNVVCMATVAQQNSAAAAIDQVASQMATAVSQSLNLNPGSTEADNISKMSQALGVSVSNSVSQSVTAAASSSQTINANARGSGSCAERIHNIDFSSIQDAIAKGVMDSTQVASATADLKQTVDQIAHAKEQSLLAFLIPIVVGIVLVIVIGMVLRGMAQTKKKGPAKKKGHHAPAIEMQPLLKKAQ